MTALEQFRAADLTLDEAQEKQDRANDELDLVIKAYKEAMGRANLAEISIVLAESAERAYKRLSSED